MARAIDLLPQWLARRLRPAAAGAPVDFASLLSRFQAVLDGNNRALEVITDLGEKLGGDYLFDVNYTKGAYAALFAAISDALGSFTLLTGNRYPQLAGVLATIDALVRRMLEGGGPAVETLTASYADVGWEMATEVGGKNYHLAELVNALHLEVPPAFAVTVAAFDAFVRHNRLAERLSGLADSTDDELAALRRQVLDGSIPPALTREFEHQLKRLRGRGGRACTVAVRSSAEEEDGEFSFAGQFESVLNVPCTAAAVGEAYKRVVASLFRPGAMAYQRQLGYDAGRLRMAVACVAMVDARISGVVYTAAPAGGGDVLLISAAWGLGTTVVDGLTDADLYTVSKGEAPAIVSVRPGRKQTMAVRRETDGTATVDTPAELREKLCLSEAEVLDLARQALAIEDYFKAPQDIEWAIDGTGRCFILQTRGLRVDGEADHAAAPAGRAAVDLPVLLRNQGVVVQPGTVAGKVFVLSGADDLDAVPRGAVLVARHDSPHFVRIIPFLNAIITDTGAPTSHMASICREFNIPTVVNTGNATTLLGHGQEVTLEAGGGESTVYLGVAHELLRERRQSARRLRELYEFRKQKYIMRYIAPLHLVNPLEEEFAPERCKTIHDLIRFMHEKSVQALVNGATRKERGLARMFGGRKAVRQLQLPVPIKMLLIDIGDGVEAGAGREVPMERLTSEPLCALLRGMTVEGAWRDESAALQGRDMLVGMTRGADLLGGGADPLAGANVAIASREYVNMSLRFGYHFNVLDCFCSDKPRNNHIFFRFVGGAAAITSRSRRIQMMARVLAEYGFLIKTKGDLLVARLSNRDCREIKRILERIGRLVVYVRQLDALLDTDEAVERLAVDFLNDNDTAGR